MKNKMLNLIMCVGAPASGKSTWAKQFVAKDPDNYARINNDDIRQMLNGSVHSGEYEKFIGKIRNSLIKQALLAGKSVIIDNVNSNRRNFDESVKIAKTIPGANINVFEKSFYEPLDVLIARDSKREGKARVGEEVVKKYFKALGGVSHKHYHPRSEIIGSTDIECWKPMQQDKTKDKCIVVDNDGTICLLNGRDPYNASTCQDDLPHEHVIECVDLYFKAGYKILFVSGREEKYRSQTEMFYQLHFPHIKYELFMRPTGNFEKDVIIKERLFNEQIKNKYYVSAWFDDRLQVSRWIYKQGLPLFRVNDPDSNF